MHAVVMGGTAGIGLATAAVLTEKGMEVTVTGRDAGRLERVADQVARTARVDGTDRAAVARFFDDVGSFEHLVLAFSPGAVGVGPVRDVPFEDVEAAIVGKVLPYLFAIRQARVTQSITMISASGPRAAVPGTVAVSAANGAIERMVSPLARELAPVRVNAVAPGAIDTDWWGFLPDDVRRARFDEVARSVPVGRVGRAEDIARAIAYLVESDYVSSSILPVDGGMTVA